jgi:AmmeMemoRadiSam system protein B
MLPKLRSLEITAFENEGEEFWHLHDPHELTPDRLVPINFGPLLALCDGTRDVPEIIADYQKNGGSELPAEFVQNLIDQLDEALLLDSPRFNAHLRDTMGDWNDNPVRPPAFAGRSYPDDSEELREYLNDLLMQARQFPRPAIEGEVRGIIVPHIDFGRGGKVEALAYRALLKAHFDTIVVLGIAHSGVHYPFCATSKSYQTPLGHCETDREFVRELQERVGPRLKSEQWAHKNEHSIEFVATFLQHLQSTREAQIVPILCGGFFEEIRSARDPMTNPDIAEFVQALREVSEIWESRGRRVGFIASVDGAHIGTQFGDPTPITAERLEQIEVDDLAFWQTVQDGDKEALHAHISRDDNARHVDAHPAVWTLLAAFPTLRAQMLHYAQAYNAEANIVVSFASLALVEPVSGV